jgi:hypothetical protein
MQMPKILKNAEEYSAQKLAGGRKASPEVKQLLLNNLKANNRGASPSSLI